MYEYLVPITVSNEILWNHVLLLTWNFKIFSKKLILMVHEFVILSLKRMVSRGHELIVLSNTFIVCLEENGRHWFWFDCLTAINSSCISMNCQNLIEHWNLGVDCFMPGTRCCTHKWPKLCCALFDSKEIIY